MVSSSWSSSTLTIVAVTICLAPWAVSAKAWAAAELPSPQSDPGGVCGSSGMKSAICDPDGVLSGDSRSTIDGIANFIADGSHGFVTADCGGQQRGYQVAVAVLHRMAKDFRSPEDRVAHYARQLHDAWGVGDAECNNGVVLLVALDDRQMYISTGRGAKDVLTDSAVQAVLSDMKGALRAKRVDLALQTGVSDIGRVLAGASKVGAFSVKGESAGFFDIFMFGFVALTFCCGSCGQSSSATRRTEYRNCQQALRRLEADRSAARQNVFQGQKSCPICLEDFQKRSPTPTPSSSTVASPIANAATSGVRQVAASSTSSPTPAVTGAVGEEREVLLQNPESNGTSGDSNAQTGGDDVQESELVLRCGHKFHKVCLQGMLQNRMDKCPICRHPMFGPDPAARPPNTGTGLPGSSSNDSGANNPDLQSGQRPQEGYGRGADWHLFYPEYLFRLNRMHYLYPRYVTTDMVNRWGDENYRQPLAADAQFRALEPRVVEAARSSGRGGSSYSFGGGGSSGGGGGGSSW